MLPLLGVHCTATGTSGLLPLGTQSEASVSFGIQCLVYVNKLDNTQWGLLLCLLAKAIHQREANHEPPMGSAVTIVSSVGHHFHPVADRVEPLWSP